MAYNARVLCDSKSPDGVRLTTLEVTFPRIVLSEFNTHRVFSRNSASSRAIPVEKRIAAVEADPFVPESFGKNQRGMQSSVDLAISEANLAKGIWMVACRDAVSHARALANLGVHKQLANRLIEPYCWQTVIVSATEWDNWISLRCNPDAQPEIRDVAEMMRDVMAASTPQALDYGEWHLPLVGIDDDDEDICMAWDICRENYGDREGLQEEVVKLLCKVSIGRCARVSYLTHDGKRDLQADVDLCERLMKSGHLSPMEHIARPMTQEDAQQIVIGQLSDYKTDNINTDIKNMFNGNYRGWVQFRKTIPHEHNILQIK